MTYRGAFIAETLDFCPKLWDHIHVIKKVRENMIDYVSAKNGGLEFTTICDTKLFGETLEECAIIIAKQGLADCVMGSSSMDFASESGFEKDEDAMTMYQYAIKMAGV
tara:strand:- start:116 stop:439 length:324 start_codon:yes stop_codon:yes gene_type:complete